MTVLGQEALRVAAAAADGQPAPDEGQPAPDEELQRHPTDEPASFDEWALARWPALLRFARLTTGEDSDAQDAVQDALVGVYPRWRELQSGGTLEAYVRRSVVNSTISRWRKFGRRENPAAALPEMQVGEVQSDLTAALSDADLAWQLCQQLPPQQRAAVVLRFYEDLSFAEIGKVLGCPESTARSHVHRALASLRTLIGKGDSHA
jgi:RNA polymerase sigma-70 factor (sigma-E family)